MHKTLLLHFSVQRQGPDGLLRSALLLSRTSRLLWDAVWRILITRLGGEAISCLMNMMLWKRNLGLNNESFNFFLWRETFKSSVSQSCEKLKFSYYQITCAYVTSWMNNDKLSRTCKHTLCFTESLCEGPRMSWALIMQWVWEWKHSKQ